MDTVYNCFNNFSPLDHRYFLLNKEVFDELSLYLSENSAIKMELSVEKALVETHLEFQEKLNKEKVNALNFALNKISTEEIYQEEGKTHHHIKALVNIYKKKLDPELSKLVHLGATSYDIIDSARSLSYKNVTQKVLLPLLSKLVIRLCEIAKDECSTVQIGRTHGQHAIPLTFGFAISEYVSRLGKSVLAINTLSENLIGKLSGAVGSYNAISLMYTDVLAFEKLFLSKIGLKPADHSTQIVEPEPLLRLLLEINIAFGIIANLADDLRNLQRTEISEVYESISEGQVGSSTMPHKRNPWNSEHVKGLWKAFCPRVLSFYMDQISEHQRDLSNSSSSRFIPEYFVGFAAAVNRMLFITKNLEIDRLRMLKNVEESNGIMAEAAYILLAQSGDLEAHEELRKLSLAKDKELLAEIKKSGLLEKLVPILKTLGYNNADNFFKSPEKYIGRAKERALEISAKYLRLMHEYLTSK